ncbi:hypothetical protein COCSUDRAFT_32521 [Coccomyxa subellipsoidea C-169]|uniref:Uncharacterized protein n=1 Tax=Coccomyxa subellipsoidea (strain C-169) TaxID=574566 RepID=I0Z6F2_COCSC|nr:hypothetical protein COCSUDRAFT_32521 [Coccomyxa subellipsoidea C-169]EIE26221.1 hypothetical protein COCSUDRAFT_32521 [Coccomyxa subellipsoidea C-169]|eukprot:XP_005650765.1 hypothetical protein COCSUDRAFT_32521 [Coccomyxa subellipsoidea C-169]
MAPRPRCTWPMLIHFITSRIEERFRPRRIACQTVGSLHHWAISPSASREMLRSRFDHRWASAFTPALTSRRLSVNLRQYRDGQRALADLLEVESTMRLFLGWNCAAIPRRVGG